MSPKGLSREDIDAVQRLRQLYPPHVLASLFDGGNTPVLSPTRESVSSFSSGSVRSSGSSSILGRNRNTGASYTSSVPATISERAVSSHVSIAPSTRAPSISASTKRPHALGRSVSDYALRDHALNVRSFPEQVVGPDPVYFCVHCGNGFEKRADWETHEWIFHERQSFWPCPQPGCQSFFDSGRAFEAHHQAVHGCGRCNHANRVVQLLPERKAWACGFQGCKDVFLDWSKRCKHVSSHYESLSRRQGNFRESPEWTYSNTIRNLLRQPELRDPFKKFMTKCHGHSKMTWPVLEWQPDKCAELQRCLEFRDFTRGVPDIIHLAYRSGHPGYSSSAQQATSQQPSPPVSSMLSPPIVSSRSSSLRSRTRSRSARSVMSNATISPSASDRSSSGRFYFFERQMSGPTRISDVPSWNSAPSLFAKSSTLTSSTREPSLYDAPSIFSSTMEVQRPKTATQRRMVAREPEVRGTSSRALLDFLKEGPPTAFRTGEHNARRKPRAVAIQSHQYGLGLGSSPSSPFTAVIEPPSAWSPPALNRKHSKQMHDFDCPTSPVTEVGADYRFLDNRPTPKSFIGPPFRTPTLVLTPDREGPVQLTEILDSPKVAPQVISDAAPHTFGEPTPQKPVIQETILELKAPTYQYQHHGHKVLPPTPGPPPSQLLPQPPPPGMSFARISFPDTPTTIFGDMPPSPMPPGFTDIANWPAPPEAAPPMPPSPALAPETPIIPNHMPAVSITVPAVELPQQPRTAGPMLHEKSEALKLMPPPKRARNSSRSKPLPLRWVSIGARIESSAPSPGVDFGTCFSQPLGLRHPPSPPTSMHV